MHLGCGDGGLERRSPHVDADPVLAAALGRYTEKTERVQHGGQVASAACDITQQLQCPARYPVGGSALPDRGLDLRVVHHRYGFLAWIALLTISTTLRSVKARGRGRSRSVKSLRVSS